MKMSKPVLRYGLSVFTGILGGAVIYKYMAYKNSPKNQWGARVRSSKPIREIFEDKLWTISGDYYLMKDFLSMTIYKNKHGGLLLYAPFSIGDDHIEAIESLGKPEVLIIPNENKMSYQEVELYKKYFPESKIVCPVSIKERLEKFVHIDQSIEEWVESENIDYLKIITPKMKKSFEENVYELELKDDQKAIIWGELLWNLKCTTGIIWKTLAIMGAAGDGIQPQVSIVHKNFGFESKNEMRNFFNEMYDKIKTKRENKVKSITELTDIENVQEIIESSNETYPIMVYQHGEPTILRSEKKIKRILETL